MKHKELLQDAIGLIGDDLISESEKAPRKRAPIRLRRILPVAAVCALLAAAMIMSTLMTGESPVSPSTPTTTLAPSAPPELIPQLLRLPSISLRSTYSEINLGIGFSGLAEEVMTGFPYFVSISARVVEILPSTYCRIGEEDIPFRLVRMQTVEVFNGCEMHDDFYMIEDERYDITFRENGLYILQELYRFASERMVLTNLTEACSEVIGLPIFTAEDGISNHKWLYGKTVHHFTEKTETYTEMAESCAKLFQRITKNNTSYRNRSFVSLYDHPDALDQFSDVAKFLAMVNTDENHLYLQTPDASQYVRYINGYATNEIIYIRNLINENEIFAPTFRWTGQHFTNEDLTRMPDLGAAQAQVQSMLDSGELHMPHVTDHSGIIKTNSPHIVAWYASTEDGPIGVVRVKWEFRYRGLNQYGELATLDGLDDCYFVTDGTALRRVDDTALLEMTGDIKTYLIEPIGQYNSTGKILPPKLYY